jgi:hypothetical protein
VQKKIRCWTCPRLPSDQVTWICCRQSNQDDGFIIGICGQCHVGRSLLTWASTWHWIYTASIYIYLYILVLALFFRYWLFRRTSLFILYVFGEQLLSLLVPSFADSKGVWITWLGNSIHSSLASIWRGTWMHNVDLLTTQCSIHYNIISYIISCHIIACYITWI